MAEARIDVVIGSAQAQSGANAVKSAVDGVKASFLDLSAKVFVAEQAIEKVWRLAKNGAEFEETMTRLNRQMGAFHGTGQQMVNDLVAISQATLSIDKAASMASRALAIGLDPSQIRTFTEAADALDEVMGTDLPTAFDQIVQAAITGRSQILANIGVYVDLEDEVKKLAVSTGRTTEQITKQERAMIAAKAITTQAGDALHKLSDGSLSDAKRLEQVEAKWNNLWLTIGRGAKNAVVSAIDALEEIGAYMRKQAEEQAKREKAPPTEVAPFGKFFNDPHPHRNDPSAHDEHVDVERRTREAKQREHDEVVARTEQARQAEVLQGVYGRAIVSNAQGKLPPPTPPKVELPTPLQGKQLDTERERRTQALTGDFDRTKSRLEALGQLYDLDAQRQILTAEDVVTFKTTLRQQELAKQGETLSRQLQLEQVFHDRRVKIGFESTEEKIEEDERYRGKVFEINQQLLANAQAFGAAQEQSEAQRAIAREAAEQQLGQRLFDQAKSDYDISEAQRQRAFDDTQTYYQGEIDMAIARFANDEDIAKKERELLRAQLAFKLRISEEQAHRLLFLRNTANFDGVRDILATADPTLSGRAKEGITESFSAKDIELKERATSDFFAGWQRGLQDYTRRTSDAFGFAQDQARRAAQGMEQGFQKFFFDGMDGKFRGFKDVLSGVLDFTKQIVAQMGAQMMTIGIIKPGASALASFFGGSAGTPVKTLRFGGVVPIEHFAAGGIGGITHRPRRMTLGGTLAEFGEGPQAEAFVPLPDGRSIPVTMQFAGAMPVSRAVPTAPAGGQVQVIVQNYGSNTETKAEVKETGPDRQKVVYVTIRDAVKRAIGSGDLDRDFQNNFGMNRSAGRR